MTQDHNSKRQVRARVRVTGERYTQARSALFGPSKADRTAEPKPDSTGETMASAQMQSALDRDGYAVVRDVTPRHVIEDLRQWVQGLVDEDLAWRLDETERRRDAGETDVRPFPRGMDGRFTFLLDDPYRRELLADGVRDLAATIGIPVYRRLGITAIMPGWGAHDGLHNELTGPASDLGDWDGAAFTWPLTEGWDGMRLVPGSHRRDPVFAERFAGAIAPHPDEVQVEAGVGDVVIHNLHIWKSGTLNRSGELRSEISLTFKRDQHVSAQIAARWANAEIRDGEAPWEPGNVVTREPGPA